jgi:sialidase-1
MFDTKPRFFFEEDIFVSGTLGYHTYRIPAMIKTNNGVLLAFCEARRLTGHDADDIDIVLRRSFDGGKSWEPQRIAVSGHGDTAGNPSPVVDRETGRIWLIYNWNKATANQHLIDLGLEIRKVLAVFSDDDGENWSNPKDITLQAMRPEWRWHSAGPCHGIHLRSGRLLIPCCFSQHVSENETTEYYSYILYSDDHGENWRIGAITSKGDECCCTELDNNVVLMNIRADDIKGRRVIISKDGGETFDELKSDATFDDSGCQQSIIVYQGDKRLFIQANAAGASSVKTLGSLIERKNMSVRLSVDDGVGFVFRRDIHIGPSAYSDLLIDDDGDICLLYERGLTIFKYENMFYNNAYENVTFAKFSLSWLTSGYDAMIW